VKAQLEMELPLFNRLSTRLTLLILVVVAILAGATAFMVVRGFSLAQQGAFESLTRGTAPAESEAETGEPSTSTDLNAIVRATLINLIAIFLFTLVGATVFSRTLLLEPIAALVRGTRELAEGHLGVTLPVTSRNELGMLAQAFNQMSVSLNERSRDLLSSNEALRVSEARFQLAMSGANDGLWDWDITHESLYLSPRWKTMLGYREDELESSLETWQELIHPDDREHTRIRLQNHLAGETANFQMEHRLRRKDGGFSWILARGASLRDHQGKAVRLAGSITDITDKVTAVEVLEERVQKRTADLAALLELSNSTALTLELAPLLEQILSKLQEVVGSSAAAVFENSKGSDLVLIASRGKLESTDIDLVRKSIESRALHSRLGDGTQGKADQLALPLVVRDATVGALVLEHREGPFSEDRMQLASAFANQVAVALENAKLYQAVQAQAALEERQHLARELHDSVSQALYGILLGAHAVRKQLSARSELPKESREALDYVENLAQAGIAEMRALIFELRPESLQQEGLGGALRKQLEALESRHGLVTNFEFATEPSLPLTGKQVLYRVAQEALHNVVKHARAEQVWLELVQTDGQVLLEIVDDGVGFDTTKTFPGHLGLKSMRERIAALGGTLDVRSQDGRGTTVRALLPLESAGLEGG
jgi:PAS domain S-box-containing protein